MATNTYVALDTRTVSGTSTTTISFTSIPATYTDLVIVANPTLSVSGQGVNLTFNNDTASNYSSTRMYGNGSTATSDRQTNGAYINFALGNVDAGQFITASIQNYSNATTYKTVLLRQNTASTFVGALVGLWRATPAAINSITLTAGGTSYFVAGSTFTIYGIAAVPQLTAKATGGTIYYGADGYVYHKFTGNGTFTPSQSLTCDYLVVAGGGGGGNFNTGAGAGGGGAGGYRTTVGLTGGNGAAESQLSLTATGYTVTVGAGGAAGSQSAGSQGSNSVFASITATGGGYGDRGYNNSTTTIGGTGGSGGGSGSNAGGTRTGGSIASPTQGFAGGAGQNQNSSLYSGGGGGGAGQAGESPAGGTGGYGGNGIANSTFANITASGASTYYAGGGGGAPNGAAGLGGGAGGPGGGDAVAPAANLGAGGGGGYGSNAAAAGSSGIVIVRYLG